MDFSNITSITIPEGSVERITETSTGRVLWEKVSAIPQAHWEIIELPEKDNNGTAYSPLLTSVDTGDGIEIYTTKGGHFKYGADGTVGDIALFDGTPTTHCADIDPVSKKWFAFGYKFYASNAFSETKNLDKAHYICCWSPELESFCAIGQGAVVINLNGETQGVSQEVPFSSLNAIRRYESLIWASNLNKFVVPNAEGITNNCIYFSSDGISWEAKEIKLVGTFPEMPVGNDLFVVMYQICWMPTMKKFIAACRIRTPAEDDGTYKQNEYIVSSSDCEEWKCECVYLHRFYAVTAKHSYSYEKKVLAIVDTEKSYITRDLMNWVEVPYIEGMKTGSTSVKSLKWSKSLNGFINFAAGSETRFYKLVIEN